MRPVVGARATGWLGLPTKQRSASGGGGTLQLDYPRVARAGLDITWRVRVTRDQPLETSYPVALAVTGSSFDVFETQGRDAQLRLLVDDVEQASAAWSTTLLP